MATTVTPAVANSIGLVSQYLPLLDEIYKAESKTAILDTAQERVMWNDQFHTFYLFETDMVGNADYSRNDGFVRGDVTSGWRAYAPLWDRGRQFVVDRIDNQESLGMAFGTLAAEYVRTKAIPEKDALRFATYCNGAAAANKDTESLSTSAQVISSLDDATAALDDDEVPYEGRILFVNPTIYKLFKAGITRYTMNGENGIDYNIEMYNDMRVITVPSGRFNTEITLAQPDSHDDAGGYTCTGSTINYMIVHPSAIMQAVGLAEPRIFSPGVWQQSQGWAWDYREYHGAWVKHQKKNGIYVSAASFPSA